MKLITSISFVIAMLFYSCTNRENGTTQLNVIDIEKSMQNLTGLKVSDFGKSIRYIPLETTDDCLIGNAPTFKVLKDYIVAETQKLCYLFDKKDGRFIAQIGHVGQDRGAYTSAFCWADEKEEFLYFQRGSNQLIKYDLQGNFCGMTELSVPPGIASCYLISDSELIGYFNGFNQNYQYQIGFFSKDGLLQDTIPSILNKPQFIHDYIESISVLKGDYIYGNWARAGAIIINLRDDKKHIIAMNAARIWRNNGVIRFKEDFVDTIYTVSGRTLIPSVIFEMGKYRWPVQEIDSKRNTNSRIFIGDVSENDNFIFFQCIKGMYSDEPVLYNGLYYKKTGNTKLSEYSNPIQDDLTDFMPFSPLSMSTDRECVSYLEAFKILDWLKEHPEAKDNEALSFLKGFDEDMNPVIVLVGN